MNKLMYRVIFNSKKGQMVVVSEHNTAQGKSNAHSEGSATSTHCKNVSINKFNILMLVLLSASLNVPLAQAATVVIPDTGALATQRPTVINKPNIAPTVNIVAPNVKGVSHNIYKQFDIDKQGVILNNDIKQNTALNNKAATVILNQVNSNKASLLNGQITVAGSKASVIIANPSGLSVNGAAFVNADKVTLTTGIPILNAQKEWTGQLDVSKGNIDIQGAGLNTQNVRYTTLLSRAASIQKSAAVKADELTVITGANTLDYDAGLLTEKVADAKTKPTVAIDTAALGGMYGNSISMIATEAGVGVNNAGTIQAANGLFIDAAGKLSNNGTIKTTGVDAKAPSLLNIHSNQAISNSKAIEGSGNIVVVADASYDNHNTGIIVQSNAANKGKVHIAATSFVGGNEVAGAHINVQNKSKDSITNIQSAEAMTVGKSTKVDVLGDLTVQSQKNLAVNAGQLKSGGDLNVLSGQILDVINNSTVTAGKKLHLESAQASLFNDAKITNNVYVKGGSLNAGTAIVVRADNNIGIETTVNSPDSLNMIAGDNIDLKAAGVTDKLKDFKAYANKDISITSVAKKNLKASNEIDIRGGNITSTNIDYSAKNLNATATKGDIKLSEATKITTSNDTMISALNGSTTATNLQINATGKASVLSGKDTVLATKAGTVAANQTVIVGKQGVSLGSVGKGNLSLNQAKIQSDLGATSLTSGSQTKLTATTVTGRKVAINSGAGNVEIGGNSSLISTLGDTQVQAKQNAKLDSVQISSKGNSTVHTGGNLDLNQTTVKSEKHIAVSSNGLLNHNKTTTVANPQNSFTAQGVASLSSKGNQQLKNTTVAAGAINIESQNTLGLEGTVNLNASGSNLLKTDKKLASLNGDLNIDGKGNIVLQPTYQLKSAGNMTIRSKGDLILAGQAGKTGNASAKVVKLEASKNLSLVGKNVNLNASELNAGGNVDVVATNGQLSLTSLENTLTNQAYSQEYIDRLNQSIVRADADIAVITNSEKYKDAKSKAEPVLQFYAEAMAFFAQNHPQVGMGRKNAAEARMAANKAVVDQYKQYNAKIDQLNNQKKQLNNVINQAKAKGNGSEILGGKVTAHNINFTSNASIDMDAAKLTAKNHINLMSAGYKKIGTNTYGISIEGVSSGAEIGKQDSDDYKYLMLTNPSVLTAANGINIEASGVDKNSKTSIGASKLNAGNGAINIKSLGGLDLLHDSNELYSYRFTSGSHGNFIKKTKWTKSEEKRDVFVVPTELTAKNINVLSGEDINTYASRFNAAKGDIHLTAGTSLGLYAVDEIHLDKTHEEKSTKYVGVFKNKGSNSRSNFAQTPLPTKLIAQKVKTESGWDTILEGTSFATLQGVDIQVGVGEKARNDAKIVLKGIKTITSTEESSESKSAVWQRQAGHGQIIETLALPTFEGPVPPTFTAPGGFVVDIPAGKLKNELNKLIQNPDYSYLKQLSVRKDTDWNQVQLAFEEWDYSQNNLTGAGAAIIALVITIVTYGAGAGAGAGVVSANAMGATTVATNATASAMANAAFASLASQAAISAINNGGDLGKVFKDLGSKESIKSLATSVITAGVANKLGYQYISTNSELTNQLTNNLIHASTAAVVSTGINGGSLEKSLETALISALAQTAQGQLASQIKGLESKDFDLKYVAHKVAHAVAGCAAASVSKGKCQDGAIGAAVGEIMAGIYKKPKLNENFTEADFKQFEIEQRKIVDTSKLVAASVATILGGDPNVAANTSKIAVENNFLAFAKDSNSKAKKILLEDIKKNLGDLFELKDKEVITIDGKKYLIQELTATSKASDFSKLTAEQKALYLYLDNLTKNQNATALIKLVMNDRQIAGGAWVDGRFDVGDYQRLNSTKEGLTGPALFVHETWEQFLKSSAGLSPEAMGTTNIYSQAHNAAIDKELEILNKFRFIESGPTTRVTIDGKSMGMLYLSNDGSRIIGMVYNRDLSKIEKQVINPVMLSNGKLGYEIPVTDDSGKRNGAIKLIYNEEGKLVQLNGKPLF